jgi:hypothetical protein
MFPYLVTRCIFELLQSSIQRIQRVEALLVFMSNTKSGVGAVEARKFVYKFTFKPFKTTFTECPSVFRRAEQLKKILIFVWNISLFYSIMTF